MDDAMYLVTHEQPPGALYLQKNGNDPVRLFTEDPPNEHAAAGPSPLLSADAGKLLYWSWYQLQGVTDSMNVILNVIDTKTGNRRRLAVHTWRLNSAGSGFYGGLAISPDGSRGAYIWERKIYLVAL